MPKPLSTQSSAHDFVCLSGSPAATFFEHATSTTATSLKVLGAASAGVASRPRASSEATIFTRVSIQVRNLLWEETEDETSSKTLGPRLSRTKILAETILHPTLPTGYIRRCICSSTDLSSLSPKP